MATRGINKVIIVGNLGNNPEVRYMPNGEVVANFSVATSESWTDKNTGQPQERTEWHRIVAYRRLGEIVGQYLKKGSKVYIEGRLQTRKWQDQQGNDRYTTEIICNEMQMLDSRPNDNGQAFSGQGSAFNAAPAGQPMQGVAQASGNTAMQGAQNQGFAESNYDQAPRQTPSRGQAPKPAEPDYSGYSDSGFDDDIPF